MYRIRPSWRVRLSWLVAPAVLLGLLAPALIGAERLAFRDISHFYTPLYEYVGQRSMRSLVPGWNPLDQTGIPLLGETTTAFFYPVRYVLFALPVSAETAMSVYVAAHLVLASLAAAIAARWSGVRARSAAIAGVVYPLSGGLVGLYLNPPFLVGAAWLPIAAGALLGARPPSEPRRALIAGMALALMVLGGDPQSALHVMLVTGGAWLVGWGRRWWRRSPFGRRSDCAGRSGRWRTAAPSLKALLAAPLIAAALSAPQLAASMSWSRHSERAEAERATAWWQPPAAGTQRQQAYQFSLPPWHLAELLTPAPWGTLLPEYRQLSALVPGDGRIWTFSIYPGLLASLALLCRVVDWRRGGIDRWSLIAVIALLLSMGHFGLVWWLQNLTGRFDHLDSAAGGAYWFLYHVVPGYELFRYPAKWLPVFSLAASLVTARWCDQAAWQRGPSVRWLSMVLVAAIAIGGGMVALGRIGWLVPAEGVRPVDRFWGPLDVIGGLKEVQVSLMHSLVVLAALTGILFGVSRRRSFSMQHASAIWLLVGVTAIDLAVSAGGWIHSVDIAREEKFVDEITPPATAQRWLRTASGGGWPLQWREHTSEHRLTEVESSQRAAWMGRWHLAEQQAVFNSMTSIQSHRVASFWRATERVLRGKSGEQRAAYWRAVRRWLAIDGESHTTGRSVDVPAGAIDDPAEPAGQPPARRVYQLVDIHRIEADDPPAGIRFHRRWQAIAPTGGAEPGEADDDEHWVRLLSDVAQRAEATVPRVTDPRQVAAPPSIVAEPGASKSEVRAAAGVGDEAAIQIRSQTPDRVEVKAHAVDEGLLTRRVYQDGHWRAWIRRAGSARWHRATVYSVDFLAQGVRLPAGRWTVRFEYRPVWLAPAVAGALLAWAGALAGWWRSGRRRSGRRRSGGSRRTQRGGRVR